MASQHQSDNQSTTDQGDSGNRFRNVSYIASGSVSQQIFAAITLWIVTRTLTAQDYGVLVSFLAIATTSSNLGGSAFSVYLIQRGTQLFIKNGYLGSIYSRTLLLALLVGTCVFPIALYSCNVILNDNLLFYGLVIFGIFVANTGLSYARYGFQSTERFRAYGISLAADRLAYAFVIILLSLAGWLTLASALVAFLICVMTIAVTSQIVFWRTVVDRQHGDFNFAEFSRIVAPNWVAVNLNYLLSSSFLILCCTRMVTNIGLVGHFGFAFRILGFVQQPIRWVTPTVLPRVTRLLDRDGIQRVHESTRQEILPLGILCSMFYVALTPLLLWTPLLQWMLGESFAGMERALILVLAVFVSEVFNSFLVKVLWSLNANKSVLAASSIAAVIVLAAVVLSDNIWTLMAAFVVANWCRCAIQLALIGIRQPRAWLQFVLNAIVCFPIAFSMLGDGSTDIHAFGISVIALAACLITFRHELTHFREMLDPVRNRLTRITKRNESTTD